MATTIPNKLYVTIQYRKDAKNDSGLLGFASPYTKDSAFEKRKQTQDNWAYGHGTKVNIDAEDQITVEGEKAGEYFICNCFPRILDNEPLEGYEIAKSVRRYGWSGSGNVAWRITDPRGFDLEISSENFATLVANSTMVNGVIQAKCLWGREGSKNVLLTENSEPYQAAMEHTKRVSNKVSLKEVKVGDLVDFVHRDVDPKVLPAVFLGKFFNYYNQSIDNETRYHNTEYQITGIPKDHYWFQGKDGKYFSLASVKLSSIVKPADVALDKDVVEDQINEYLANNFDGYDNPNFVTVKRLGNDITFDRVEFTGEKLTGGHWPTTKWTYARFKFAEYDGKLYTVHNNSNGHQNTPELYEVESFVGGVIKYAAVYTRPVGYWNRSGIDFSKIPVDSSMLNNIELFDLFVVANGKSYKVHRFGI